MSRNKAHFRFRESYDAYMDGRSDSREAARLLRVLTLTTAAFVATGAGNVFGRTSGEATSSVERQSGTGAELQAILHGEDLGAVRGARPMRDLLARLYEPRAFQP